METLKDSVIDGIYIVVFLFRVMSPRKNPERNGAVGM